LLAFSQAVLAATKKWKTVSLASVPDFGSSREKFERFAFVDEVVSSWAE
jgi:hypothetical protein